MPRKINPLYFLYFLGLVAVAILIYRFFFYHVSDPNDPAFIVADGKNLQVTRQELEEAVDLTLNMQHKSREEFTAPQLQAVRASVLDFLVSFKIAEVRASEIGNLPGLKELEESKYQENLNRFGSKEAMVESLEASGLSFEWMQNQIHQSSVLEKVVDHDVLQNLNVPESDVVKYYQDNPKSFVTPERYRLARIFITIGLKADPSEQSVAKQNITKAFRSLQAGTSFTEVAQKYSQDPFVNRTGGDRGYVSPGELLPEEKQQVEKLSENGFSPVFRTSKGWEILKLSSHVASQNIPFNAVHDSIHDQLLSQLKQKKVDEYHQQLPITFHVTYHIDLPKPDPNPMPEPAGSIP